MKKPLIVLLLAFTFIACNKEKNSDKKNELPTTVENNKNYNLFKQSGAIPIVTMQLHRNNGSQKRSGKACDCARCFGICDFHIGGILVDSSFNHDANLNVVIKYLNEDEAKMYILEEPDEDVTIDPTLFVDHDVEIDIEGEITTIKSGEYLYDGTPGTVTFFGNDFNYYGTVVVDIE